MLRISHAKINLGLHITDKRDDGYHNIESVFYPIGWADIVEVLPAQHTAMHISGYNPCGSDQDNICMAAHSMLQKDYGIGNADIYLHKRIPSMAGLGGGSSNGAAALLAANDAFGMGLSQAELQRCAAALGSDCPFFLQDQPMLAQGRGTILTSIDVRLQGMDLVVIKPNVSVSTWHAYSMVKPKHRGHSISSIMTLPPEEWKHILHNDFEEVIFKKHPLLGAVKRIMYQYGAIYASMSGSGSAIYGIFNHLPDALYSKLEYYGQAYRQTLTI
jgi:4-diphosphocytidyl-2-C-methyl-D-erythritol kinase